MRVTCWTMAYDSRFFRMGQRVWLQQMSGNLAARCVGRYKNRGRYVSGWVRLGNAAHPLPEFKVFDVDDGFAQRHKLEESHS